MTVARLLAYSVHPYLGVKASSIRSAYAPPSKSRSAAPNREVDQRWKVFPADYRQAIVAFDLLTVPTPTFELLYCFPSSSMAAGEFYTAR
jgi:hypothetical protein